jgi:hypothetical protein
VSVVEAGAAVADITPGFGVPMGGYGARKGVAEGVHDPLQVRALVLSDGSTKLAIAVCDLVGVMPDLVNAARDIIERETGIPASNVLISATHTHSGPGSIRIGVDEESAHFIGATARKIAGAVRLADRRLVPVSLKVGTVEVSTISQNRRDPDGPIETVATVLLAAPPGNGPAVCTLVNYACHSTVLEADNLEFSADFPGAMARFLESTVGGVGVYLQGAAGNINPAWMSHDFHEVERVGGILGAAATRTAHELRPVGEGQWVVNLNWSEETPKETIGATALTDVRLAATQTYLDLRRRTFAPQEEIAKEIKELESELRALDPDDIQGRRAIHPRLNQLRIEWLISGRMVEGGLPAEQRIELQVMRLSDEVVIVTLPGEFFVETGKAIVQAVGRRHVLIAGYANDFISYVPSADQFAHAGYEVGCAQFEPDTDQVVTDALVAALHALDA